MSRQPIEPDQQDYLEQDVAGDSADSTWIPPDEPMGSHSKGITAEEKRQGETFDERTKHTNPEIFDEEPYNSDYEVGRLVQPGDEEVDSTDDEADAIALDQGPDDADLSAEEAAMHTTDQS